MTGYLPITVLVVSSEADEVDSRSGLWLATVRHRNDLEISTQSCHSKYKQHRFTTPQRSVFRALLLAVCPDSVTKSADNHLAAVATNTIVAKWLSISRKMAK